MHPALFDIEDAPAAVAQPEPPARVESPPARPKKLRGFTCPDCRGVRLFVYKTRLPIAGRIVRYRKCLACGYRMTTEERFGHALPKIGTARPLPRVRPQKPRMPRKQLRPVVLTAEERFYLTELLARATLAGDILALARILLLADESGGRPSLTNKEVAAATGASRESVGKLRQRLTEDRGEGRIGRTLGVTKATTPATAPAEQAVSEAA